MTLTLSDLKVLMNLLRYEKKKTWIYHFNFISWFLCLQVQTKPSNGKAPTTSRARLISEPTPSTTAVAAKGGAEQQPPQQEESATILVWNELHLKSKASGIWQSDKIDKHFFHYKTLVNISNCRCNNRQTLFETLIAF